MNIPLEHHVYARTDGCRVVQRRNFLRAAAAGGLAAGATSWTDGICRSADDLRGRGMACILLWMTGGPSQFETFSPKPDHDNGGPTKAIPTNVAGIHVAENLPALAQTMDELAIIRSVTSKEGSHPRASYLMHHGYLPMGGVKFPTLGSQVAHQISDLSSELPNFVRIGGRGRNAGNGGFLGVQYDPFRLNNPSRPPENTTPPTGRDRYARRLGLLGGLESDFGAVEGADVVADHRTLVQRAAEMILSPQMEAFDLEREPPSVRESYGSSSFGAGCLLARRLVEAGVTFVEVDAGGWDTHDNNFERTTNLTNQIDQPVGQLIADLKARGLLESTLVVWMGEFGRTPKINARNGRDHYPRAFNVAMAGGGVRGGQVIGATNEAGTEVTDRPVQVTDLFRSIYHALQIDADHENMSLIGRPIKLVDGGEVVHELFAT